MLNSTKQREDPRGTHTRGLCRLDQCQSDTNTLGAKGVATVTAGRKCGIVGKSRGQDSYSALAGCAALGKLLNLSEPQCAHPQYRKNRDGIFLMGLI